MIRGEDKIYTDKWFFLVSYISREIIFSNASFFMKRLVYSLSLNAFDLLYANDI